jgi:hypothetical protein
MAAIIKAIDDPFGINVPWTVVPSRISDHAAGGRSSSNSNILPKLKLQAEHSLQLCENPHC